MLQTAVAATVFAGFVEAPFRRIDAASDEPQGLALCIGLNRVDEDKYSGWDGQLDGCLNDARAMTQLAKNLRYYDQKTLLDDDATIDEVRRHIAWAANDLRRGDIFLLSCSSHGGQCRDTGDDEDGDSLDETWCLYDGQWIDDDRRSLFEQFKPGVRLIVVGDMCHSGTSTRAMEVAARSVRQAEELHKEVGGAEKKSRERSRGTSSSSRGKVREFQAKISHHEEADTVASDLAKYAANLAKINREYYDGKLKGDQLGKRLADAAGRRRVRSLPEALADDLSRDVRRDYKKSRAKSESDQAAGLLFAACQDDQTALDGNTHGLFTEALLSVWDEGRFRGTHSQFFTEIKSALSSYFGHAPNLDRFGGPGTAKLLNNDAFRIR